MNLTAQELAARIDHTLLAPEATVSQIDALCDETVQFGFAAVCVNPIHIQRVADRLGTYRNPDTPNPAIVSVAGFPLGASTTETKADEARRAIDAGATEIDMVIQLGALVCGDRRGVRSDIERVAHVVHQSIQGGILKVILETAALPTDKVILGCRCAVEGEADFVKTSTGFHTQGGASVEHVRLLKRHAPEIRVKASGGIRTVSAAVAMIEAGADRLGTSAGVAILEEFRGDKR